MRGDVEWGTPPPSVKRRGELIAFVERLRERPGEWAKYPHPMASSSAAANRKRFPDTEWTQRQRADGLCDIYGRWVGNGEHQ